MRRYAAWPLGLTFVAGLLGPDALAVALTAFAAFMLGFVQRRKPWHWAVVALTAWASGAGVGTVLRWLENAHDFFAPSQAGAGATVLVAYTAAFAGAWVNWVTSRIRTERADP